MIYIAGCFPPQVDQFFCAGPRLACLNSPLRDLILQQRLAVLQRQTRQLQEVDPAPLCADAQEVARPQQEQNRHPGGAVEQEAGGDCSHISFF